MEKNLKKVRDIHPVRRHIEFENIKQVARFVNMYREFFYISKDDINEGRPYGFVTNKTNAIWFTIKKSDFEMIKKDLNLKDKKIYRKQYWKFES